MWIKRIAKRLKKWRERNEKNRSAVLLTFDGKEEAPMKHWVFGSEMDAGVLFFSAIINFKPKDSEWHNVLIAAINNWNDKRKRQDDEAGNDEGAGSQGAE